MSATLWSLVAPLNSISADVPWLPLLCNGNVAWVWYKSIVPWDGGWKTRPLDGAVPFVIDCSRALMFRVEFHTRHMLPVCSLNSGGGLTGRKDYANQVHVDVRQGKIRNLHIRYNVKKNERNQVEKNWGAIDLIVAVH
jgi:hypothetical protein